MEITLDKLSDLEKEVDGSLDKALQIINDQREEIEDLKQQIEELKKQIVSLNPDAFEKFNDVLNKIDLENIEKLKETRPGWGSYIKGMTQVEPGIYESNEDLSVFTRNK